MEQAYRVSALSQNIWNSSLASSINFIFPTDFLTIYHHYMKVSAKIDV